MPTDKPRISITLSEDEYNVLLAYCAVTYKVNSAGARVLLLEGLEARLKADKERREKVLGLLEDSRARQKDQTYSVRQKSLDGIKPGVRLPYWLLCLRNADKVSDNSPAKRQIPARNKRGSR